MIFLVEIIEGDQAKVIDAGITRIACQPSVDEKLSIKFHILSDLDKARKDENGNDYCNDVLENYHPDNFGNSTEDDEDSNQNQDVQTLMLGEEDLFRSFKQCPMTSCGDLCGDCEVRFYHNSIDGDEHFDEVHGDTESRKTSRQVNIIFNITGFLKIIVNFYYFLF